MSKSPGKPKLPIDPIFDFAHEAVSGLPRRKQRVLAVYYVRALQTNPAGELTKLVPANLYRPIRRLLADADWDYREVIWRAAAQVLPRMEVEWLGLGVTAIREQYAFAWLAAHDHTRAIPLDLVLVGPAHLPRSPADHLPAQLDILGAVPDEILRRAPVAIADALAERSELRRHLEERGVTYSATLARLGRATTGVVIDGRRRLTLTEYAEHVRRTTEPRTGPSDVDWCLAPVDLEAPDGTRRRETAVIYWHQGALASIALTNETSAHRLDATYNPARPDWLARPRPRPPWRGTRLRSARAWEHHLALLCVLFAARANREISQ